MSEESEGLPRFRRTWWQRMGFEFEFSNRSSRLGRTRHTRQFRVAIYVAGAAVAAALIGSMILAQINSSFGDRLGFSMCNGSRSGRVMAGLTHPDLGTMSVDGDTQSGQAFEIQPAELEVNRSRFTSTQVEVDRTVFLPGCPAELPVCRTSAPISIRWPVVAAAPRKPPSKSLGCSRCNVCRRTAMVFGVLQLPPPRLRVCRGSTPPTMAKPTGCAGESQPGTAPVSVGAAAR
jgi:hypothetical protein